MREAASMTVYPRARLNTHTCTLLVFDCHTLYYTDVWKSHCNSSYIDLVHWLHLVFVQWRLDIVVSYMLQMCGSNDNIVTDYECAFEAVFYWAEFNHSECSPAVIAFRFISGIRRECLMGVRLPGHVNLNVNVDLVH